MKKYKGIVVAGDKHTAETGKIILEQGGNAYDALLACLYTAPVAEPVLASLGGGGFLLAYPYNKKPILYDFFSQTPFYKATKKKSNLFYVTGHFGSGVTQDFYIGLGSIAVPGSVKGIFKIHKDLCSMSMSDIVKPAIKYAKKGVPMSRLQSFILNSVVGEIYKSNKNTFNSYRSKKNPKKLLQEGESNRMPYYADFIENLAIEGEDLFYKGYVARHILKDTKQFGGHLTKKDFENYKVFLRKPLETYYMGNKILTNPPPSSGGILIAFTLHLLEKLKYDSIKNKGERLELLARSMEATDIARLKEGLYDSIDEKMIKILLSNETLSKYLKDLMNKVNRLGSTTQISIIDKLGNIASMTVTNGEGSSYIVPNTDIMLNNMLGEEDLNPKGLGKWTKNTRMTSMMAPSILIMKNGEKVALGSGGSNRIRSAIVQVMLNIMSNTNVKQSVENPRIHFENNLLNIEHGFDEKTIKYLKKRFEKINVWTDKNMYYGGAHTAMYDGKVFKGSGDPRRGGVVINV